MRTAFADNFFEDGDEDAESTGAENGALGDVRDVFGFGDGDGETVAGVDVQHHVDVGAAIAGIDYVIGADFHFGLELVEERDFAVAGGGADNGVNFAGAFIFEFCAMNAIGGKMPSSADWITSTGAAKNVEIEVIALDAVVENFIEQADIGFEADFFSHLD